MATHVPTTPERREGEPLEATIRPRLERALGGDLGEVRIHTGAQADLVAAAVGADAVTAGSDIYFRAGRYDPACMDGLRLLGHEAAHTLQQSRWGDGAMPMRPGYGLEAEADQAAERVVRGLAASPGTERLAARRSRPGEPVVLQRHASWEHRLLGDASTTDLIAIALSSPDRTKILTAIRDFLGMWRDDPDSVTAQRINARYPRIRTLTLQGSGLLVTYGELNTLPDYMANPTVLDQQPRAIMLPILQAVRQEGYNWVNWLLDNLVPTSFKYAVSIPTNASFIDLLAETKALDALTANLGPAKTNHYTAAVSRNACHFAPFSWYRWEQFHLIARDLATQAYAATDSGRQARLTSMAWVNHGFADHFLQDSFAAGHLVNKNLVMQWFVEWAADKWYVPVADWDRVKFMTESRQPALAAAGLYNPAAPGSVRDPQTAEEQAAAASRMTMAGVRADGSIPRPTAYANYLAFLDSTVVQSASGVLHDHFNASSLWVASPSHPTQYRIWGDDTMLNGGDGVGIASGTAQLSQQALLELLGTGQTSVSVQSIRDRFPASVSSAGSMVSLQTWNQNLKSLAFGLFPDVHYYVLRAYPSIGNVSVDTTGGWVWKTMPGSLSTIAAGADGSVWGLGSAPVPGGYGVYSWNGSGWTQVPGAGVRIAVGPDGLPWLVNDAGCIYRRTAEGTWKEISGAGYASDIGAGADGSVWMLGTAPVPGGRDIYSWNGDGWTPVPGAGVRIAVGPDGLPWLINEPGNVYQRTAQGTWKTQLGNGCAVSVGQSSDGPVWLIGFVPVPGGYGIFAFDGTTWVNVDGGATQVAVDSSGAPWLVNATGAVYRRVPADATTAPAVAVDEIISAKLRTDTARMVDDEARRVPAAAPSSAPTPTS